MAVCTSVLVAWAFFAGMPHVVWQQALDGGATDKGHGSVLCLDKQSILVAGETGKDGTQDYWVYELSLQGDSILAYTYDNDNGEEIGFDVAVAPGSLVFVSGTSLTTTDPKFLICGFSQDGEPLWSTPVTMSGENHSPSLYCRHEDSCYMAGWHRTNNTTYVIVRQFHADGSSDQIWGEPAVNTFALSGVDVDTEGQIYYSSSELTGVCLFKMEPDGSPVWMREFEGADATAKGWQCRVAPSSDVFLCGEQFRSGTGKDYLLLKWNAAGTPFWPSGIYYDLGDEDNCRDLWVDAISDCYLAGWQERGEDEDVALVKTDSAGNMLWSWVDTLEGKQEIEGIEVDEDGYIYLAGSHHNGENWDMLVMKIRQPLTISGRVTDSAGAPMASVPIKFTGDTLIEVVSDTDGFYEIEVYNGGSYTLEPDKPGWVFTPPSRTYDPLAHREFNQDFDDGYYAGVAEPSHPLTFNLEIVDNRISYSVPYATYVKIAVYDVQGRLVSRIVDGEATRGIHELVWKGKDDAGRSISSGIYFMRMNAGEFEEQKKIVVLR